MAWGAHCGFRSWRPLVDDRTGAFGMSTLLGLHCVPEAG
jgi:hypothetical protein